MLSEHFNSFEIKEALIASGIGIWCFDEYSGNIKVDSLAKELLQCNHHSGTYLDIFSGIQSDDLEFIKSHFDEAKLTGKIYLNIVPRNCEYQVLIKAKRSVNELFYGTIQKNNNPDDKLKTNNSLATIVAESPVAVSLYLGRDLKIALANDVMLGYWGKSRAVIGQRLEDALPELQGQPFAGLLKQVFDTGIPFEITEAPAVLAMDGKILQTYYFDYSYKALFDSSGKPYAILNTATNVTDRVVSRKKVQQSEELFRGVVEQSPIAIGFLMGEEMIVEIANERILNIWGKSEDIIGLPLTDALPEIKGQGFTELLEKVYKTGIPYKGTETLVKLYYDGVLTDVYVDFTYSALKDDNGVINGVLVLASDVSDRINAIREIAASEEKFRSVIYSAQAAVAVFRGPQLIADIINDEFLRFTGRNREEFEGLPLTTAMPEIIGQQSLGLMHEVLTKGIKTHHYGRRVDVLKDGVLTPNYYNVSYSPLYNSNGEIYAVLDIAIDVTETIKTQEALREAEASLRGAIELADLGTWSLDPISGIVSYSKRMADWFGFDGNNINVEQAFEQLGNFDRERVEGAVEQSADPFSEGLFDEEFSIKNALTGVERILHAQGKTFFDADGKPYLMTGTAQDITSIKQIQLALENEVKERTEALWRANQELEEINQKLVNTNQELEQYAYVASHDLQEPLRKISMFSNLLKERDTQNTHAAIIEKIVKASDRMSLLIRDLLEFSRLLNPDSRFIKVELSNTIKTVLHDFELLIEEKGATVNVGLLPEIEAVPLQMNQLFYNLIGNGLKFVSSERKPEINISAEKLSKNEVKRYLKNPIENQYYNIKISDNGIGIEEQYQKQIFEVFKRLHSRSEYSGSGIGLAICKRIINHHSGNIFIESVPGAGTTFNIVLPERQSF